jgi:predicted N-acetyltransferase YhbS
MEIIECRPQNQKEEIREIKRAALKDANAYDEDDKESSYSNYRYFVLAKIDGKGVGTAAFREPEGDVVKNLKINDKTAELKNVHVRPEYQREGIGSKLLRLVEEKAEEKEYKKWF